LFEEYLSLEEGTPEKKSTAEKLQTVVREIQRSYTHVTKNLENALAEDEP
jgi:hypothetical protein